MSEPDKRCGCKHPGCNCRFPDGFTLPTRCDKCGELMSAHGAYMVNRGWILTCPITREERPYPPGPDPRKPAPMCLNCGAELVRDPDTWECNRCGEGYALDDPRLSPAPPDPTPQVEADEEARAIEAIRESVVKVQELTASLRALLASHTHLQERAEREAGAHSLSEQAVEILQDRATKAEARANALQEQVERLEAALRDHLAELDRMAADVPERPDTKAGVAVRHHAAVGPHPDASPSTTLFVAATTREVAS